VHFLGRVPYQTYLSALQVSSAHVYLTYPFLLSWSLLEAMSTGCVVIGSDTPPVREVIDSTRGILVPFFDIELLADSVVDALTAPHRFKAMREEARRFTVENFMPINYACQECCPCYWVTNRFRGGRKEEFGRGRHALYSATIMF
jgi:glycosyltransferase involved in cell wall biosynthesis